MTPEAFRAALAGLGYTQAEFGRLLVGLGHPAVDVPRSVRRWCKPGGPGAPGEVDVIIALLRIRADREAVEQVLAETEAEAAVS